MRKPIANCQLLITSCFWQTPWGQSRRIADSLSSFKGPHGANPGISWNYLYLWPGTFPLFFRLFFHTPFFHLFVTKHSPTGSQKVLKIVKIFKKTSTRSSLENIPAKSISKVWKSFQRSQVHQKASKIGPRMDPGTAICEQNGDSKKQQETTR